MVSKITFGTESQSSAPNKHPPGASGQFFPRDHGTGLPSGPCIGGNQASWPLSAVHPGTNTTLGDSMSSDDYAGALAFVIYFRTADALNA